MPGVIMDPMNATGSHTNHDRDQTVNGANGDKTRVRTEPQPRANPNGVSGKVAGDGDKKPAERTTQLPPEIVHITQGYLPLSGLLARLAQKTHTKMMGIVTDLAQMPFPSAVNGNSYAPAVDDNSPENIKKKERLLRFAQDTHADWVKALVITEWSRKSEDVSKIIDLKVHLDQQRNYYDLALHEMSEMTRSLGHARLPNPDLKTAIEVLSTGRADWMPELNYIEPPPLTATELLRTLENLNTLLSIRLSLHEYDKMPFHFKDYTIKCGRATFRVAGEFEVDLTIADENPETQFWFIDFRFLFSPAPDGLSSRVFPHIESQVNAALLKDGLQGCYTYFHEMVLTHKIGEIRRQAVEMARSRWIDGLKVEPLNRSLCIQYWVDRYGRDGPKSWIILGVNSGRRRDGRPDPKTTSHLSLRWFRDSKEVKDVEIPFDAIDLSAESLMKTVISKHVNHILTSTYDAIKALPLFAGREASVSQYASQDEPAESHLKVQMTSNEHVTISIEPVTGRFIFSPASRLCADFEFKLNTRTRDPAKDAHSFIEGLRCAYIIYETVSRGISVGWKRVDNPGLKSDELKPVVPKDTQQLAWFRRPGWEKNWFAALSLSMSGEHWWLFEIASTPLGIRIASRIPIPIKSVSPVPTYQFLSTLGVYTAGLIAHYTNLRALHLRRVYHIVRHSPQPSTIKLPDIRIRLSDLLPPSKRISSRNSKKWARNVIKLSFQGIRPAPPPQLLPNGQLQQSIIPANAETSNTEMLQPGQPVMMSEARLLIPVSSALSKLSETVDRDIAFHASTGAFVFRLYSLIGQSVIPALIERLSRVDRLLDFADVLHKHAATLQPDTISLGKIAFNYGSIVAEIDANDAPEFADNSRVMPFHASIDISVVDAKMAVDVSAGNPHIRILDQLNDVLNSNDGLQGVAIALPLTTPVLCAFDTIEAAWDSLTATGEVFVFLRAVEWYNLRYSIFLPTQSDSKATDAQSQPDSCRVSFDIKLAHRRHSPWWLVRRTEPPPKEGGDTLSEALSQIFRSSGEGWVGMRTSAVGQISGVKELLTKLDAVVRVWAVTVADMSEADLAALTASSAPENRMATTASRPPTAMTSATAIAADLKRKMMTQGRFGVAGVPTPAQTQSGSQGSSQGQARTLQQQQAHAQLQQRNLSRPREVVEID